MGAADCGSTLFAFSFAAHQPGAAGRSNPLARGLVGSQATSTQDAGQLTAAADGGHAPGQ